MFSHFFFQSAWVAELADFLDSLCGVSSILPDFVILTMRCTHNVGPVQQPSLCNSNEFGFQFSATNTKKVVERKWLTSRVIFGVASVWPNPMECHLVFTSTARTTISHHVRCLFALRCPSWKDTNTRYFVDEHHSDNAFSPTKNNISSGQNRQQSLEETPMRSFFMIDINKFRWARNN